MRKIEPPKARPFSMTDTTDLFGAGAPPKPKPAETKKTDPIKAGAQRAEDAFVDVERHSHRSLAVALHALAPELDETLLIRRRAVGRLQLVLTPTRDMCTCPASVTIGRPIHSASHEIVVP